VLGLEDQHCHVYLSNAPKLQLFHPPSQPNGPELLSSLVHSQDLSRRLQPLNLFEPYPNSPSTPSCFLFRL
jgi:hypothetical protein